MSKKTKFHLVAPVLSSSDIDMDIIWYKEKIGKEVIYREDWYAVLRWENLWIHLQWHIGIDEDPIHSSVIKIYVEGIDSIFQEFIKRGTDTKEKLKYNTPWQTNEFAFYDLNKNAIYFNEHV